MESGKRAIASTQNWANGILAVIAMFAPGISEFVVANPEIAVGFFSVLNILWRTFITKKPIISVL